MAKFTEEIAIYTQWVVDLVKHSIINGKGRKQSDSLNTTLKQYYISPKKKEI